MKKLLIVSAIAALGFTSIGFAGGLPEDMPAAPAATSSDTGVYVGVLGGWGFTNWKNNPVVSVIGQIYDSSFAIEKDNGLVGRAVLGYDINRYFAVEAGYSYFFNKADINNLGFNLKTQAVDLYFKGKLPVVENFDLYAKVGAGWLFASSNTLSFVNPDDPTDIYTVGGSQNNINVAVAFGADYSITSNVIASFEWSRIAGSQSYKSYMPNTDAFMVGVRYKFDL